MDNCINFSIISTVGAGIGKINNGINAVKTGVNNVKTGINNKVTAVKTGVNNVKTGIQSNIRNKIDSVKSQFKQGFNQTNKIQKSVPQTPKIDNTPKVQTNTQPKMQKSSLSKEQKQAIIDKDKATQAHREEVKLRLKNKQSQPQVNNKDNKDNKPNIGQKVDAANGQQKTQQQINNNAQKLQQANNQANNQVKPSVANGTQPVAASGNFSEKLNWLYN